MKKENPKTKHPSRRRQRRNQIENPTQISHLQTIAQIFIFFQHQIPLRQLNPRSEFKRFPSEHFSIFQRRRQLDSKLPPSLSLWIWRVRETKNPKTSEINRRRQTQNQSEDANQSPNPRTTHKKKVSSRKETQKGRRREKVEPSHLFRSMRLIGKGDERRIYKSLAKVTQQDPQPKDKKRPTNFRLVFRSLRVGGVKPWRRKKIAAIRTCHLLKEATGVLGAFFRIKSLDAPFWFLVQRGWRDSKYTRCNLFHLPLIFLKLAFFVPISAHKRWNLDCIQLKRLIHLFLCFTSKNCVNLYLYDESYCVAWNQDLIFPAYPSVMNNPTKILQVAICSNGNNITTLSNQTAKDYCSKLNSQESSQNTAKLNSQEPHPPTYQKSNQKPNTNLCSKTYTNYILNRCIRHYDICSIGVRYYNGIPPQVKSSSHIISRTAKLKEKMNRSIEMELPKLINSRRRLSVILGGIICFVV